MGLNTLQSSVNKGLRTMVQFFKKKKKLSQWTLAQMDCWVNQRQEAGQHNGGTNPEKETIRGTYWDVDEDHCFLERWPGWVNGVDFYFWPMGEPGFLLPCAVFSSWSLSVSDSPAPNNRRSNSIVTSRWFGPLSQMQPLLNQTPLYDSGVKASQALGRPFVVSLFPIL